MLLWKMEILFRIRPCLISTWVEMCVKWFLIWILLCANSTVFVLYSHFKLVLRWGIRCGEMVMLYDSAGLESLADCPVGTHRVELYALWEVLHHSGTHKHQYCTVLYLLYMITKRSDINPNPFLYFFAALGTGCPNGKIYILLNYTCCRYPFRNIILQLCTGTYGYQLPSNICFFRRVFRCSSLLAFFSDLKVPPSHQIRLG